MSTFSDRLPYALRQFETDVVVPIRVLGIDVSMSTATTAKITTVLLVAAFFLLAMRARSLVPGRLQLIAESAYSIVAGTVLRIAGPEGRSSIPFFCTLAAFILIGTLLGMTPLKETFTSHLVVTLALSLAVFVHVNVIAFRRHGWSYLAMFLPRGVPAFAAPLVVAVEVVSYLFRPLTLGFRIFANIVAGHIMLKLFGDFAAMLVAGLGPAGLLAAVVPVAAMIVIYAFEIMVVCIQTYIFVLISSMYLRDAIRAH